MPRPHLRNSDRDDLGWNLVIKILPTIPMSEEGSLRQVVPLQGTLASFF